MEIAILSPNCLKIKGKNSAIIIDPETLKAKNPADAVILLKEDEEFDASKIEGSRLLIKGPGEYEFAGVKVTSLKVGDDLICEIHIDGLDILMGKTEGVEKIKDKLKESQISILYVNEKFDPALITAIEPRIAVFYGENANEAVKGLGKSSAEEAGETVKPVSKFAIKLENLPEEMEIVLLG